MPPLDAKILALIEPPGSASPLNPGQGLKLVSIKRKQVEVRLRLCPVLVALKMYSVPFAYPLVNFDRPNLPQITE